MCVWIFHNFVLLTVLTPHTSFCSTHTHHTIGLSLDVEDYSSFQFPFQHYVYRLVSGLEWILLPNGIRLIFRALCIPCQIYPCMEEMYKIIREEKHTGTTPQFTQNIEFLNAIQMSLRVQANKVFPLYTCNESHFLKLCHYLLAHTVVVIIITGGMWPILLFVDKLRRHIRNCPRTCRVICRICPDFMSIFECDKWPKLEKS